MVGFNRRFIPMVASLKEKGKANLILMQKNRFALPDLPRRFIVEDFIHVIDTLRFLMNEEVIAVVTFPTWQLGNLGIICRINLLNWW